MRPQPRQCPIGCGGSVCTAAGQPGGQPRAFARAAGPMDAVPGRWTLRFQDARAERGFVASRHAELCASIRVSAALMSCICLSSLVIVYKVTEDPDLSPTRMLIYSSVALACLASILLVKSPRLLGFVGPVGLEVWFTCVINVSLVLLATSTPAYMVRVAHLRVPKVTDALEEMNSIMRLQAVVSATHLWLPIRWVLLWHSEVVAALCFMVPALLYGTMSWLQVTTTTVMLMGLLMGSSIGKRALERHERAAFAQVLVEKTMRIELEHRLEAMASSHVGRVLAPDDAASLPTTTHTGELFGSVACDVEGTAWDRLMKLGMDNHWLVLPGELHLQPRLLGVGNFGMVLPALYHGAPVVVKAPKTSAGAACAKSLTSIVHELRIFRHLHHPNIAGFYGAFIEPASNEILLVMEYICGVQLQEFVGVPPSLPDSADRCKLAQDVCCALRYLHAQVPCIVHGDLKGSNALVEECATGPVAKLVDFGLSRLVTRHCRPMGGTPNYVAPEVLQKAPPASAADVFSFGRLLYLVMTGLVPLKNVPCSRILESAGAGRVQPMAWPNTAPLLLECQALCEACTREDPKLRPDMLQVHGALQQWARSPACAEAAAEVKSTASAEAAAQHMGGVAAVLQRTRQALATQRRGAVLAGPLAAAVAAAPAAVTRRPLAPAGARAAGRPRRRAVEELPTTMPERAAERPRKVGEPPGTGGGGGAAGAAAQFLPTPDHSKDLSILGMLSTWSIEVRAAQTCCGFHAAARELRRAAARLKVLPCAPFSACSEWQCPRCLLLGDLGSELAAQDAEAATVECAICGWEDKFARPAAAAARTAEHAELSSDAN